MPAVNIEKQMVCCSEASDCLASTHCLFGKPHVPDNTDAGGCLCHDHKPPRRGGIMVWAEVIVTNAPKTIITS